jgi:integrase
LPAIAESRDPKGRGNCHTQRAARLFIAAAGSCQPEELTPAHVYDLDAAINESGLTDSTRNCTAYAARWLLRHLARHYGAAELDGIISRQPATRPRNVTATEAEKAAILAAAKPHLRLWILLCSDLAIRSGTAARLGPDNYDPAQGLLHFVTKMGERLTLPVTTEIAKYLDGCNPSDPRPFVEQVYTQHSNRVHTGDKKNRRLLLERDFLHLRRSIGITRKLTPHDFRRTTAVKLYEATGDIRDVQALLGHRNLLSTVWYLDHDLRPVNRKLLEFIKLPQRKEKTA